MLELDLRGEGLTPAELRLVHDWTQAWRARISKANGIKPRSR